MSGPNLEEAAAIATEYISSLDNLPSEIQFLLTEIQQMDNLTQELLQEIAKESAKYMRHSSRGGSLNTKDAIIPQTVKETYLKIDQIADEKLLLAQRVVDLIARARARLDYDLERVLVQQGEDPVASQSSLSSSLPKRSAVQEIRENLRSAIAREATPVHSSGSTKRRKLIGNAAGNAIKLPSPAPPNIYTGLQRSSRLASAQMRQSPFRTRRPTPSVEQDEDAEGEEDIEDGGEEGADPEDKTLYCFCQKLSYGEMIACDNEDCRYQWFHLGCVGVKGPLPDNWFCPDCSKRLGKRDGGISSTPGIGQRKGRKK